MNKPNINEIARGIYLNVFYAMQEEERRGIPDFELYQTLKSLKKQALQLNNRKNNHVS